MSVPKYDESCCVLLNPIIIFSRHDEYNPKFINTLSILLSKTYYVKHNATVSSAPDVDRIYRFMFMVQPACI